MRGIALKTEMKKKVQLPVSPCNIHLQTKGKKNKYNENTYVNYYYYYYY